MNLFKSPRLRTAARQIVDADLSAITYYSIMGAVGALAFGLAVATLVGPITIAWPGQHPAAAVC